MTTWHIILIASAATLALKLAGHLVPAGFLERERPARIADLLTVALLAALIAVQTLAAGSSIVIDARVPAVIVAAALYALRVPFVVVVIVAGRGRRGHQGLQLSGCPASAPRRQHGASVIASRCGARAISPRGRRRRASTARRACPSRACG